MWLAAAALTVSLPAVECTAQAPPVNAAAQRGPAYQRNRQHVAPRWSGNQQQAAYHRVRDRHTYHDPSQRIHRSPAPGRVAASGTWFQRPYPYHLDYYRMRYGGTYEPYYSGGLYGTPQVIAPPVYGYGFGYGQPLPYGYAPGPATGYGPTMPAAPPSEAGP